MTRPTWLDNVAVDVSAAERLPTSVLDAFLRSWDGAYGCAVCTRAGNARRDPTTVGAVAEPGGHQLWFAHRACRPPDEPAPVEGPPVATGAERLRLAVSGFTRPGAPPASLVLTVRGLGRRDAGGGDTVDALAATLLGAGLELVASDWSTVELSPAAGWEVEWDDTWVVVRAPGGEAWYDGPWDPPAAWGELAAGGAVALLAAADLELRAPVGALDEALGAGRLVGGAVAVRRRPPH
ncbi:MAG: hypothetical protein IPM45_04535 [Acidimicrobiales bacterium]|nr:hypothetical protein [Acidimicrobiales bacterium]